MAAVFVDSAAWIAVLNVDDQLHSDAMKVIGRLQASRTTLITTEFVLLEVADALSALNRRERTVKFVNRLRQLKRLIIVPADSGLLQAGWSLYSERHDKGWGLTDCISIVVMTERGVTDAFTSDRHFEQAGFQRLLNQTDEPR